MKKPELMCPIQNWASLEACKEYADAVYFGVSDLSLKAASGIKVSELEAFIRKCHSYGIKAYLTVNSTIYNPDISLRPKSWLKRPKTPE